MSEYRVASLPCMRRQCGTCNQWQGKRRIESDREKTRFVATDECGGACRDGAWRNFSTLPHQTCDHYQRWEALLDEPSDPVVLSTISQLHREIRLHSHLAEPLPKELREKLDELLLEIEIWYIRRYLACGNEEERDQEWFSNEFVSGVFDCFYYLGWSHRKPVSSMTLDDVWPLTEAA